jgi:hypothetical protein
LVFDVDAIGQPSRKSFAECRSFARSPGRFRDQAQPWDVTAITDQLQHTRRREIGILICAERVAEDHSPSAGMSFRRDHHELERLVVD